MVNDVQSIICSNVPGAEHVDGIIPCFRCGLCCIGPRIHLDFTEARRISENLGISWPEFEENYLDSLWLGGDRFLLRQNHGVCVFLKQEEGKYKGSCLIHQYRPFSCVSFTAGLFRRQCQAGLAKYWGLDVSPSGQLRGSDERMWDFYSLCSVILEETTFPINITETC